MGAGRRPFHYARRTSHAELTFFKAMTLQLIIRRFIDFGASALTTARRAICEPQNTRASWATKGRGFSPMCWYAAGKHAIAAR